MPRRRTARLVAHLWDLAWNGDRLSCSIYRARETEGDRNGLEMRLHAGPRTILSEPVELRPRALARIDRLKRSLKRRGWREAP